MKSLSDQQRVSLETTCEILRARERSLRGMAQSSHCAHRAEAEAELGRVREQLDATYAQLRHEHPSGFAGPRYPRG